MTRNIPLFIAFRLLFNARFYYPIFAVIQLDYGLTIAQFAILNAVWAVSIVLLEVPSGALADRIGRKKMVVVAAVLMVLEMAVLAFVPLGNNSLVFWAWVLNRILSGAAEASASGADEALAYDSIPKAEQKARWPKVLTRLMTLSSFAFVAAMLIGSLVYDGDLIQRVLNWMGSAVVLEKETVIRFPIYLTLATALAAVIVSLFLREPPLETECGGPASMWSGILGAGRWILATPVVAALIFAALAHDSVARLFLTSASEYYRLIGIPIVWFGVIGAAFSGLGIFTPKVAEWLVTHRSGPGNYRIVTILLLIGLVGVSFAMPGWGLIWVVFLGVGFGFLNFFTSHYLNAEVDSRRRATVLSFKGLALNLGFGVVSVIYGGILQGLRMNVAADSSDEASRAVFRESLPWLPVLFVVLVSFAFLYYWRNARGIRIRPL